MMTALVLVLNILNSNFDGSINMYIYDSNDDESDDRNSTIIANY